jgi:hypothetical protein
MENKQKSNIKPSAHSHTHTHTYLLLVGEQLDVGVKQVSLGHMDVLNADLIDQTHHTRGDTRFSAITHVIEVAHTGLVFQHDAVQLRHVQLVAARARGNVEGEALALCVCVCVC